MFYLVVHITYARTIQFALLQSVFLSLYLILYFLLPYWVFFVLVFYFVFLLFFSANVLRISVSSFSAGSDWYELSY